MFEAVARIAPAGLTGVDGPDVSDGRACAVTGLSYTVDGARIIDKVDLTMAPAGLTVFMGPNGAGKSVLMRLLHGMLTPTGGEIRWGGAPLDEQVRRRQAMVFQTPVLLRRSVRANIAFVLSLRGRVSATRCEEVLAAAGLDTLADRPARSLSGGERQRLAIGRALATEPDVLFLDEPTASLDPASMAAIEQIIGQARNRGVKMVLITHDLGQARRLGDDVVFMNRGKIVEQGPARSFFEAPQSRAAQDYLAGRIVL